MKPRSMYVPLDISELRDFLVFMLLDSPDFIDETGYFPYRNLSYVFEQLHAALELNRPKLGEERYEKLQRMSAQIRALFEADPENKTGEARKGKDIIYEMEEIVKQVRRKS